jgi:hypothetical protein
VSAAEKAQPNYDQEDVLKNVAKDAYQEVVPKSQPWMKWIEFVPDSEPKKDLLCHVKTAYTSGMGGY